MTTVRRRIFHGSRGNTLIGVMVGLAIMEITGTAVVTALGNYSKQQVLLDLKTNSQMLTAEMQDELSKLATCTGALNTTDPLAQNSGDGTWPLAMHLSSVPGVPLVSGSNRPIGDYGLSINRLYLDRLSDTGLKGPNGQELYTGDVIVSFNAVNDGTMQIRSQTVGQLFLEINNSTVLSCASGDDPSIALAMACSRVGGSPTAANQVCDMTPFSNSMISRAMSEVRQQLYSTYLQQVMTEADRRIASSAASTLSQGVATADGYTDQNANAMNNLVGTDTTNANQRVTQVNNALQQNATDLTNQINAVNTQSNNAQSVINQVNATSAQANQRTNQANATTAVAAGNTAYAITTSQAADQNSYSAQSTTDVAGSKVSLTNSLSAAANSQSYNSNLQSNAANGVSAGAVAAANWANQTSASANNYAGTANGLASGAVNYANQAGATANTANYYANATYGQANAVYPAANDANAWSNASLARPSGVYQNYYYGLWYCQPGIPCGAQ